MIRLAQRSRTPRSTEGDSGVVLANVHRFALSSAASGRRQACDVLDRPTATATSPMPTTSAARERSSIPDRGRLQKVIAITVAGDRSDREPNADLQRRALQARPALAIADRDVERSGRIRDGSTDVPQRDRPWPRKARTSARSRSLSRASMTATHGRRDRPPATAHDPRGGPSPRRAGPSRPGDRRSSGHRPRTYGARGSAAVWAFQAAAYETLQVSGRRRVRPCRVTAPAPGDLRLRRMNRFSLDGGFDWTYCEPATDGRGATRASRSTTRSARDADGHPVAAHRDPCAGALRHPASRGSGASPLPRPRGPWSRASRTPTSGPTAFMFPARTCSAAPGRPRARARRSPPARRRRTPGEALALDDLGGIAAFRDELREHLARDRRRHALRSTIAASAASASGSPSMRPGRRRPSPASRRAARPARR